jgi:hypothetical protein
MSVSFAKSNRDLNISNEGGFSLSGNNFNLSKERGYYDSPVENNDKLDYLIDSDQEENDVETGSNNGNEFGLGDNNFGGDDDQNSPYRENVMSFEEMQTQKAYYLGEIERLTKNGVKPLIHLDMSNELNEISGEYHRMKHYYETEVGIRRMRSLMMYSVNFLETFDNSYNLIGDLDGFSLHTQANINEYDDIFAELYNKYKDKVSMGPELRLLFAFGGSLAQFKGQKKLSNMMLEEQNRVLTEKLNSMKRQNSPVQVNRMKGPSMTSDERLRQFGIDEDISDFSDISSIKSNGSSSDKITFISKNSEEPKEKKKRGRKKKNAD